MSALLTSNGRTILEKRYLDGGTVGDLWDRVSGGNAKYRKLMEDLLFLPNSPALFNMGKNNGCTSSACFVFDVADEMRGSNSSIVGTREKAIAVAKAGGGVGYWLSALRPKGALIKSIHRKACGPVTVLRDYHGISALITQGGKRELAQMGVLDCDHTDVSEFIHCKDNDPQGLGSFNISVGWKEKWLREIDWTGLLAIQSAVGNERCGNARTSPFKETALWREQCESAWHHGCPGMFFPDRVNQFNFNKHLGLINAPNPCGETPNRSNEPCSLASISLGRFFLPGSRNVDWNLLEEAVYVGTEFLDDILDRNEFPHPDITEAALLTRKLGLGVMGWADLLAMCHIQYDTEEAVALGKKTMKFISDVSNQASIDMAKTKGPYKGYSSTLTEAHLRRNETTTSIAPTGTISIIAGCKGSGIEPWYGGDDEEVTRTTSEGMKLTEDVPEYISKHLDGFRPKTAHQIAPSWHVRHQAAFQQHTDLGVSKTINLPNSASVQDVSDAYKLMWELGCKGGTIFRNGCRSEQVLQATKKTSSVYSLPGSNQVIPSAQPTSNMTVVPTPAPSNLQLEPPVPRKVKLPNERFGSTMKFHIGSTVLFLTHNAYPGGRLGEIFVNGNFGTTMAGLLNAFCITFSVALQNGTSLEELIHHHQNTRFEPCGVTDNKDVPICTSIPDLIVRWLRCKYLSHQEAEKMDSGIFCPDCGTTAIYQSGCLTCPSCHWSRCG